MAESLSERLTSQFYNWERIGRGWYVFNSPVELEPEFIPFFGHFMPQPPVIDDGKRHTVLSYLSESVRNALSPKKQAQEELQIEYETRAYRFDSEEPLTAVSLSLPEGEKLRPDEIIQLLVMLSQTEAQISFEIIATGQSIRLQFVCRESDTLHVQSQVKAFLPKCILHDRSNELATFIVLNQYTQICDLGLKDEFTRPIAMPERFDVDPLTGLFGVLEHLQENDRAIIQVLFKGTVNPWASSIIRSVTDGKGDSFFMDAPEMPKLAQQKTSSPLFGVVIRIVTQSTTPEKTKALLNRISATFAHAAQAPTNALIPLVSDTYDWDDYLIDIVWRRSRRLGMILNAQELATFVHYPFSITSKKLERDLQKTKAAPAIAEGHTFALGKNYHQGVERTVTVSQQQRLKHMHVIGATGTGKSTMLQSCIVQDINAGNGIAVLDPHGDLIEGILPYIPENRYQDVIIVDPADSNFPVGFNILSAYSDIEKDILASDLVSVFRRLSSSFGDQMHSVLANAILAFVESTQGGSLIDLRRFLIEKPFRDSFLKTVTDPSIVYYWKHEYPLLKSNSIGSILTRLDSFLRPKVIRNMVAQKKSLDFENILDAQKILFIKLSQGLIGTENSYLLGTFFVSKIYQAAMARQVQAKAERKDFFLYIDEFQNFITPSMSAILSGTRKYGLGCILAHQDMIQLQKQDTEIASAVISNAGTRVCFRLGDIDAKRFEDGFSFFEAPDLQNLGVGQAIARIERPEYDFNMTTLELKEADLTTGAKETVIALSREKYGTAREEVEKTLEYLRGEQQQEEIQETHTEVKISEPVKKQPTVTEADFSASVTVSVPIDEAQKIKTTENLVRQKELSQHRYLQTLIKKMAEARGFVASIEELTPDGQGRVDVSLERNGKKIACEIGVTTSKVWETHNVEKCLNAGYEIVVAVPVDKQATEIMRKQVGKKIPAQYQPQVLVLEADELFHYLDKEIAKDASTETRIKGYRVKVEYDAVSEEEMKKKRESVTKMVVDSAKKKKNEQ
ncbi:MAG: type IV secretion system DNA-binding domain-containing protein [Bacteroidetes bacterium]|nr:type IV secretion system DNA-binding domain-containing protein [Bacteroidota bacterium]